MDDTDRLMAKLEDVMIALQRIESKLGRTMNDCGSWTPCTRCKRLCDDRALAAGLCPGCRYDHLKRRDH